MVGWEVPIGAAIAFTGGALSVQAGHSHGSVQQGRVRLLNSPETAGFDHYP